MEITTCERYVLAELEAARAENEALRGRIAELEREVEAAGGLGGAAEPRQVRICRLDEPLETAYLSVKDACDFRNMDNPLGLTAEEAREKASTEEGLREVAESRVGWRGDKAMVVRTVLWPCQLNTGTQTFVMDLYDGGRGISEARVLKDDEAARAGEYFPARRAGELERRGLEILKKNLIEYADMLDAEEAGDGE